MSIDDSTIIQAIRDRTECGFRLLMRKYREPVYWHVRRLVVDYADAEDATQETFVRIFRFFSNYRESISFRGWIFRIATNEALRLLEARKQKGVSLDAKETVAIAAATYVDYTDLEAVKLQKAIQTLPPKQQAAFNMRYYDEMTYEDIADAIDSTPASVKMNYHLAKDKIIKYMKQ